MLSSHPVRPLTIERTARPRVAAGLRHHGAHAGRTVLAPALLLVLLGGCNPPKEKPAATSPTACADFSKKVCEAAGADSPTCASAKDTTELMPAPACAVALAAFPATKAKLEERRKSCEQLVTKLCTDLGPQTETCDMVKTQSKNIPPDQCTKMMQPPQYPELLADLKKRESRNQPLAPEQAAEIAKAGAPAFGPETSGVKLVAFSDFQCPYCKHAAEVMQKVKAKYSDRVHVVFRQFPLAFHKQAHLAAEAALAAHAQGKFWEYHDKLFADQNKLDRPGLESSAKELGLNMPAFKKALDTNAYTSAVDTDMKLGEQVMVNGTPTMFLNGKRVADPTNFEAVAKQIDEALAKTPS